jgi:DNA transformation protein
MTHELGTLKGIGPKSIYQLQTIGVHSKVDLIKQGAIPTYLKLKQHYKTISLNFLYALVGALEDKHWREIATTRREELLLQVEGQQTLAAISALKPTVDYQ